MTLRKIAGLGALLSLVTPGLAMADEAVLNSGDTAWMLTATALVLFMTIPGLALFYSGMVRSKNVLSVMMQCFAITGLISILWVVYGYSLAFDTTGMEKGVTNLNSFVGGLNKAFLSGLTPDSLIGAFPESVFIVFQMTFAIITPALIVGAFAERMKFSAMLIFMAVWFTLVYAPIAHMVWFWAGPDAYTLSADNLANISAAIGARAESVPLINMILRYFCRFAISAAERRVCPAAFSKRFIIAFPIPCAAKDSL